MYLLVPYIGVFSLPDREKCPYKAKGAVALRSSSTRADIVLGRWSYAQRVGPNNQRSEGAKEKQRQQAEQSSAAPQ